MHFAVFLLKKMSGFEFDVDVPSEGFDPPVPPPLPPAPIPGMFDLNLPDVIVIIFNLGVFAVALWRSSGQRRVRIVSVENMDAEDKVSTPWRVFAGFQAGSHLYIIALVVYDLVFNNGNHKYGMALGVFLTPTLVYYTTTRWRSGTYFPFIAADGFYTACTGKKLDRRPSVLRSVTVLSMCHLDKHGEHKNVKQGF